MEWYQVVGLALLANLYAISCPHLVLKVLVPHLDRVADAQIRREDEWLGIPPGVWVSDELRAEMIREKKREEKAPRSPTS